jgi:hypothetical protein
MGPVKKRVRTALGTCLLTICAVLTAAGCAGGQSQQADGAPADDGSTTCPQPPDLTAASPVCNGAVNSAHAVPFTARTGAPPVPSGGPIVDGVYVSTATEGYGAVTPAGRRITLVVLGGASQILWTGEVLDATAATVTLSFAANTHASATGNQLAFTVDCSSTSPAPIPAALTYTATAGQLVLSLANGANTSVTTYTRTGCP